MTKVKTSARFLFVIKMRVKSIYKEHAVLRALEVLGNCTPASDISRMTREVSDFAFCWPHEVHEILQSLSRRRRSKVRVEEFGFRIGSLEDGTYREERNYRYSLQGKIRQYWLGDRYYTREEMANHRLNVYDIDASTLVKRAKRMVWEKERENLNLAALFAPVSQGKRSDLKREAIVTGERESTESESKSASVTIARRMALSSEQLVPPRQFAVAI